MPLKILIIPDKFKGTLPAAAVARAIARGWQKMRPADALKLLPMSDGGDGFGEILGRLLGAKTQTVRTVDAARRPIAARWWWERRTKTAIIESACVIGLARLPHGKFHPFELDTFGLGAVIEAAAAKGARRCLIGIGGSATNDGGFGLARAAGWRFLNRAGDEINRWTDLHTLTRVHAPRRKRWFKELIVAVDVQNPLLGKDGATRVYGPQKGLQPGELAAAEKKLRRLARVLAQDRAGFQNQPGAGAAGGLGFGLLTFLGARVEAGFDVFARHVALEKILHQTDLVITGEGRLDASTYMGKGVGQITRRCRQLNITCFALAGMISPAAQVQPASIKAHALTDMTTPAKAQARPAFWLEKLAQRLAKDHYHDISRSQSLRPRARRG